MEDLREVVEWLANGRLDCMTVDEAYRAHRNNLRFGHDYDAHEPNNLLAFIQQISMRTLGLLLAAATPLQIHPVVPGTCAMHWRGDRRWFWARPTALRGARAEPSSE